MSKIANHYEVTELDDLKIRLGDLDLYFDTKSAEKDLSKRLFDLDFTEANLIGVSISGKSKTELVKKKEEKMAAGRRLKKEQK